MGMSFFFFFPQSHRSLQHVQHRDLSLPSTLLLQGQEQTLGTQSSEQ